MDRIDGKPSGSASEPASNEPYCNNCGYVLTGLVDSSKCPECGRPIVEVLTRPSQFQMKGVRYKSRFTLFGWPAIHVAMGPADDGLRGRAKGIIAIGDIATGGVAIGGIARGIVALGGVAFGLASIGGLSIGLLSAWGGAAIAGFACGGGAVGLIAHGGGAVGIIAQGGGAYGRYARGGNRQTLSPEELDVFSRWAWLLGNGRSPLPAFWALGVPIATGAFIAILVLIRYVSFRERAGPY